MIGVERDSDNCSPSSSSKSSKHYLRQQQLSLETRAVIAECRSRYPKMDEQEKMEMQKKINRVTRNVWCRYIREDSDRDGVGTQQKRC